jgi:hypothetical protein
MKRITLVTVASVFIVSLSFLVGSTINKVNAKKLRLEKIEKLPSFTFLSLDYISYSSSEILHGPLILVHFHPECEHCRYEISELSKSKLSESGIKIILISSANIVAVKQFLIELPLSKTNDFITLLDTAYTFEEIFGRGVIPTTYLYDKDLHLIKVLSGECKIETIHKLINESR